MSDAKSQTLQIGTMGNSVALRLHTDDKGTETLHIRMIVPGRITGMNRTLTPAEIKQLRAFLAK